MAYSRFKDEVIDLLKNEGDIYIFDTLTDMIDFIRTHYDPESVFDTGTLDDWAQSNGYTYGREY